MPIYEFYCADCHTVFNFLSRKIATRKRPACPRCAKPRLERRASTFAVASGRTEAAVEGLPEGADPQKMERAMAGLAAEAERTGDDDPRAVATLMRRFYETSGMPLGDGLNEALRRLEGGEDPETIEAEMGDVLEAEEGLAGSVRALARRRPPKVDTELHEL